MTKSDIFKAHIEALRLFKQHDVMLKVDQCARYLNLHSNTVKSRIEKRKMEAVFQGGKYHIPKIQFLKQITTDLNLNSEQRLLAVYHIKSLTVFNAQSTIFTMTGCADYLQVTLRTIKNRIQTNTIDYIVKDGKYYIPKLQFLENLTNSFEDEMQEAS